MREGSAAGDDSQACADRRASETIQDVDNREGSADGLVPQQTGGPSKHGDGDIRAAIAVEVAYRQPSPEDRSIEPVAAGSCRGDKRNSTGVPSEQSRAHLERNSKTGPIEDVSIRLNQVEPPVAVEVHRGNAETQHVPRRTGQSEGSRGIFERRPRTWKTTKSDGRSAEKVGDRQIRSAVAVEVSQRDAHSGDGLRVSPSLAVTEGL